MSNSRPVSSTKAIQHLIKLLLPSSCTLTVVEYSNNPLPHPAVPCNPPNQPLDCSIRTTIEDRYGVYATVRCHVPRSPPIVASARRVPAAAVLEKDANKFGILVFSGAVACTGINPCVPLAVAAFAPRSRRDATCACPRSEAIYKGVESSLSGLRPAGEEACDFDTVLGSCHM